MAATSAFPEPAKETKPQSGFYEQETARPLCTTSAAGSQFLLPAFPKRVTYRERCAVKTPNPVDIASRARTDQQRVKGKLEEGLSSLYNHHRTCGPLMTGSPGVAEVPGSERFFAAIYFQFFLGRKLKPGGMESGAAKGCEGRGTRHNNNLYSWLLLGVEKLRTSP
jgi:hypothetical protein